MRILCRNVAVLFFLSGCRNQGQLAPAHLVTGPRIVAIIADPPEALPGEDIELSVHIADTEDDTAYTTRWRLCLSGSALLNAVEALPGADIETLKLLTCETDTRPFIPETTSHNTARIPGELTDAAWNALQTLMPPPDRLPPTDMQLEGVAIPSVERVMQTAGIPFMVELTVTITETGQQLQGRKRVALSTRSLHPEAVSTLPPEARALTTNPPDPRFSLLNESGEMVGLLEASGPGSCILRQASGVIYTHDRSKVLSLGSLATPWLESYPRLGLGGELLFGTEDAYHTVYVRTGAVSVDRRGNEVDPLRQVISVNLSPSTESSEPVWLVVRDGHLGVSYCKLDVQLLPE